MYRFNPTLRAVLAGLCLLAASASGAAADTTVVQFEKLSKAEQAHTLGNLLQSLAENLERSKRSQEAQCLVRLYTNSESEARLVQSPGMADFFAALNIARDRGLDDYTVEEIITRQMVQYCGTRPSKP